ncbi:MAG: hypothetical protein OXE50_16280, partial [Chloroflexi bacterium]|nr:hypothetical protein [Chloroflexota bacterium]
QAGLRATVTGDGSLPFPTPGSGQELYDFIGGVNGADLGTSLDVAQKFIELVHHTGHDEEELADYLNGLKLDEDTTLYAIVLPGSDPSLGIDNAPLNRPFTEFFSPGSLPRPTEAELEALGRRIDDLTFADIDGEADDSQVPGLAALGKRIDDLTFADIDGEVADAQVPQSFTRDSEITRAFLLNILGLTQAELDNLFVGAQVEGTGTGRSVLITQADGSTIRLNLPQAAVTTGGTGAHDGVVSNVEFSPDGTTLTLTLSTGGTITANVPAILRESSGSPNRGASYAASLAMSGYSLGSVRGSSDAGLLDLSGPLTNRLARIVLTDADADLDAHLLVFIGSTIRITRPGVGTVITGRVVNVVRNAANDFTITIGTSSANNVAPNVPIMIEITSALVLRRDVVQIPPLPTTPGRYELQIAADQSASWVAAGGGPTTHPSAYIAWSDDTAFTAAEFKAGQSVEGANNGAVPAQAGFAYLALWLEGDHWDVITGITIANGPDGLHTMEAAVDLAIDGEAGKYRRFTARSYGPTVGGRTLRWTQ